MPAPGCLRRDHVTLTGCQMALPVIDAAPASSRRRRSPATPAPEERLLPEAHGEPARASARPGRGIGSGKLVVFLTAVLLIVTMVLPAWMQAASDAKVVVIVGPVGSHNSDYKDQAREVIAEARRHTANVVVLFTPKATWSRVKQASAGASVLVYFGHGWGYPSRLRALRRRPDERDGAGSGLGCRRAGNASTTARTGCGRRSGWRPARRCSSTGCATRPATPNPACPRGRRPSRSVAWTASGRASWTRAPAS